jgi:hypothetical protein
LNDARLGLSRIVTALRLAQMLHRAILLQNFRQRAMSMTDQIKMKTRFGASRREFGFFGAVAAFAGIAQPAGAAVGARKTVERSVTLDTGIAGRFFKPAEGEHSGLVMWGKGDAASARVAKRLAADGWAVLLVNSDDAAEGQQMHRDARAHVAWLDKQPGVASTGRPAARTGSGLGHGYSLRNVTAALPRFAFADAEERKAAAASATLFAVPDSVVPAHRVANLNDAAQLHLRLSA